MGLTFPSDPSHMLSDDDNDGKEAEMDNDMRMYPDADLFRAAREHTGMSQRRLAQRAGKALEHGPREGASPYRQA